MSRGRSRALPLENDRTRAIGVRRESMDTYVFSGYARLPQDVSHQALYSRLGVMVEVDEKGVIVVAGSTLIMDVGRSFFARLISGKSVLTDREEILHLIRTRYLGNSQGALCSAVQKVFDAVDRSPLAGDSPPGSLNAVAGEGGHSV
jgi:hypothetical protein